MKKKLTTQENLEMENKLELVNILKILSRKLRKIESDIDVLYRKIEALEKGE